MGIFVSRNSSQIRIRMTKKLVYKDKEWHFNPTVCHATSTLPPLSHLPHIAASLPIDKSSTGSACSLFSPHKLCKSSANLVWPCLSLDSILVLAKTITEQEWSALWEDQIAWPPGFNNTGLRSVVKVKGEFISHYNNLQFLSLICLFASILFSLFHSLQIFPITCAQ